MHDGELICEIQIKMDYTEPSHLELYSTYTISVDLVVSLSEDVQKLKRELTAKEEELAKSLKMKEGSMFTVATILNLVIKSSVIFLCRGD